MTILSYIGIYLLIGAIIMAVLDILHYFVKGAVDDEFKDGYKNWERVYIIATWPVFTFTVLKEIIKSLKQK